MTQQSLPTEPPDVAAEKAIRAHVEGRRRRLYALVQQLSLKTGDDPAKVMRTVTAYEDKRTRRIVPGKLNAYLLSDEALEKSIADAEGWLDRLGGGQ